MWERKTFHEYARELEQVSSLFRDAHTSNKQSEMQALSQEGVALLRILALGVRSEQDHGLTDKATPTVGVLLVNPRDVVLFIASYAPPYSSRNEAGSRKLDLRGALNKIAHADPTRAEYRASTSIHELLLTGTHNHEPWVAVISIPELCAAVRRLPDRLVPQSAT